MSPAGEARRGGRLVVGLTGPMLSGKTTVARLLEEKKGFRRYSFSQIVRECGAPGDGALDRTGMQDAGDELRCLYGPGHLARRIIERMEKDEAAGAPGRAVVEGFRHPEEIREFLRIPGFILVGLVAPRAVRFRRGLARGRPDDFRARAPFDRADRRDAGVGEPPWGQHMARCLALARRYGAVVRGTGGPDEVLSRVWRAIEGRLNP